eukprot:Clim_evm40s201 gene=Clim_evmTU40s201
MSSGGEKDSVRGILKHGGEEHPHKTFRFDEKNIEETEKEKAEFAHIKIDEPKTPYEPAIRPIEGESEDIPALGDLHGQLQHAAVQPREEPEEWHEDEHRDPKELEEEHHRAFEQQRKYHYDEALHLKQARELAAKELAELEDEDDD